MTQEDKELLLKDLCVRLPYGVKVHHLGNHKHNLYKLEVVAAVNYEIFITSQGPYMDNCPFIAKCAGIEEIKPYLFPLSSMTEEQKRELKDLISQETNILIEQMKNDDCGIDEGKYHFIKDLELDWLIKNHFDYRGLIPKGLAIDATGLNIY